MDDKNNLPRNTQTYSFRLLVPHRSDIPREEAFMKTWWKLVGGESLVIDMDDLTSALDRDVDYKEYDTSTREIFRILRGLSGGVTPHAAAVATSFIHWLSRGNGNSYLQQAQQLAERMKAESFRDKSDAFLAAWTIANRRHLFISNGKVYRESIMELTGNTLFPSHRDYETMEMMASWLGSEQGQTFLADTKSMTNELHAKKHQAFREKHGLGN